MEHRAIFKPRVVIQLNGHISFIFSFFVNRITVKIFLSFLQIVKDRERISSRNFSSNMAKITRTFPPGTSEDTRRRISSKDTNSEETNENEDGGTALQSQNPSESNKHFMSPRSVIERNATFGTTSLDTQMEKTQNFGREDHLADSDSYYRDVSSKLSESTPSKTSQPGDDSLFSPDLSSSLPYDPVTNYLSPRPQFLRYDPKKRLKILLSLENEMEENLGLNGDFSSDSDKLIADEFETLSTASGFSSQADVDKEQDKSTECVMQLDLEPSDSQEMEVNDEDVDGFEEEKKEISWCLSSVLNLLSVLSLLMFAVLFVPSTTPPPMPSSLQSLQALGEGYLEIHDPLPHVSKMHLEHFWKQILIFTKPFFRLMGTNISDNHPHPLPFAIAPPTETSRDPLEDAESIGAGYQKGSSDSGFVEDDVNRVDSNKKGLNETGSGEFQGVEEQLALERNGDGDPLFEILASGEIKEELLHSEYLFEQEQDKYRELINAPKDIEAGGISEEEHVEQTTLETWEKNIDQISEISTIQATEVAGVFESRMVPLTDLDSYSSLETQLVLDASDGQPTESDTRSTTLRVEISQCKENIFFIESMIDKSASKTVFGFFVFSLAVWTCTMLGFVCRKSKKASATDFSPPTSIQQLASESIVAGKNNSKFPVKLGIAEKSDTNVNASSVVHYDGDRNNQFNQTCPPTVELLGEYEVGLFCTAQTSPKSKTASAINSQEKSVRSDKDSTSGGSLVKPSNSEFSTATAECPSYGSITIQAETLVKKLEGEDREIIKVTTTPVRRSSRLRNRINLSMN